MQPVAELELKTLVLQETAEIVVEQLPQMAEMEP
jgi:hypothetical protein